MARKRLDSLARSGAWRPDQGVLRFLDEAADVPGPRGGATAVCHGDLHVRHLLVGEAGEATGVIDWGDLCLADPAIDLSLAYAGFTGRARAALLAEYGPVTAEQEHAARVLAVFLSATLAEWAADEGRDRLLAECLAGIGRSLGE